MIGRHLPEHLYDSLNVKEVSPPPGKIHLWADAIVECLLGGLLMPKFGVEQQSPGTLITPNGPIQVQCPVGEVSKDMDSFNDLYNLKYSLLIALTHKLVCRDGRATPTEDYSRAHTSEISKRLKPVLANPYESTCKSQENRAWKVLVVEGAPYFVAGIKFKAGMVNFQLPIELWDLLHVDVLEVPPLDDATPSADRRYSGSEDIIRRLLKGLVLLS